MSDGIVGGIYKDAKGDGYHNAHGEKVTKDGTLAGPHADGSPTPVKAKRGGRKAKKAPKAPKAAKTPRAKKAVAETAVAEK
jgi:hypothetical protein